MDIEKLLPLIPLARGAEIAGFHPCGLIAINKKAGIKTHPNSNDGGEISAVMARYNFDGEYFSWIDNASGEKLRLHLINRIDSPTSGLILACFGGELASATKRAFMERQNVKKEYAAIVCARGLPKNGEWIDHIAEKSSKNYVRSYSAASGTKACARFTLISTDENRLGLSLLKLEPKTGLTHQLRVQCAKHRMPILGDRTYGNFNFNRRVRSITGISRMFLHCGKVEISLNFNMQEINFKAEAPLPESFDSIMKYNNKIAGKMAG